jgi:hypothetical protein
MADSFTSGEELATKVFKITLISAVLFIGSVLVFVL